MSQERQENRCGEPAGLTAPDAPAVQPRRGFLAVLVGSTLGLGLAALGAVAGLWTAAGARFLVPNTTNEPAQRFRAGTPRDYPPGCVETRYGEPHGVWISRVAVDGRGRIVALSATCTHLGCITMWLDAQREFRCPCHGSAFTAEGINREGPAPRPLERYAIRLTDDGHVEIDKSRVFRQELGQWDDPDSFIPVS